MRPLKFLLTSSLVKHRKQSFLRKQESSKTKENTGFPLKDCGNDGKTNVLLLNVFLLMVFLLFAGFAFAQGSGEKKVYKATIDADGVQRMEVLGGGYFFNPNYIIVKVNVPVELIVKKESGIVPHNIVMKAPDAGMDFNETLSDKPKIIQFTPKKVGKYPFYCDKKFLFFKNHKEKGMEGMLEVIE